jgi:aldose 1-epimerase
MPEVCRLNALENALADGAGAQVIELDGGVIAGQKVRRFQLTNPDGMRVEIMDYGATLLELSVVGDRGGRVQLNLGMTDLEQYADNPAYFGATCGRYSNRIARGRFVLDGQAVQLTCNDGRNHLHGGIEGFNRRLWQPSLLRDADQVGVRLTYTSLDGDQGYPGRLDCQVDYLLNTASELTINYRARVHGGPTAVNLTNHSYWNLAGEGSILDHEIEIAAERIVEVDAELIPTGNLLPVADTAFDFTKPRVIGTALHKVLPTGDMAKAGYDHCYVRSDAEGNAAPVLIARLRDPASSRIMEVLTDQPGLQFYVGSYLDGSEACGGHQQYAGLALECQQLPDAPNQPGFPDVVLRDDEIYQQRTIYRFMS